MVAIPDADVLLAGDLVEESAAPAFGSDSYPLDWPQTLDAVLGLTTAASVVVPGHGAVVGRDFVANQRHGLGVLADTIRGLRARGVPLDQALRAADWPFPEAGLADAIRRGYEQLPYAEERFPAG